MMYTNQKSHMDSQLIPILLTLNDPDSNDCYTLLTPHFILYCIFQSQLYHYE